MKKIALLLASVVLALFLSEIGLRLLPDKRIEPISCRKLDPVLDHSLVPNSKCRFKTREWDVSFNVNSQGLMDFEYSVQKPPDTYRILMLGDSYVEGFGVNIEDSYTKIFEKLLNENSRKKIEVIDAGISGWGPLPEYLFLRDYGIKYQPDLVVLNFNSTDFFDDYKYYSRLTEKARKLLTKEDQEPEKSIASSLKNVNESNVFMPELLYTDKVSDPNNIPFLSEKIKFFLNQHFYVYRTLTRGIKLALGRAVVIEVSPMESRGKIDKDLFAITRTDQIDAYKDLFAKPQQDILKMKKLTDANKAQFYIIFIPHGHMVGGNQWTKGRIPWGFEKGKIYSSAGLMEMVSWAAENGIDSLNLIPNLKEEAKDQKLYFDYDGHWNKKGNEVVAKLLLAVLGGRILNK